MSHELQQLTGIAEANRNQWNNVVEQSALGCVYHRYGWLRAVEDGTPHEPRHLLVSKKGNPIAILPNFVTDVGPVKQLTSVKPGYGGPVAVTDEEEALELLLDGVADLCGGTVLFNALRPYDQEFVGYHRLLVERGYDVSILSCRFTLDLARGWDAVFDGMHGERRRGIRRGNDQASEIVDEDVTDELLTTFYEDYATVMDRVDYPRLPRSFVRELRRFDERVKVFSLRVDGARRGMYLYVLDEEQSALQHLFTAVTEEHFEYHAPELLHEHAIRWAIDEGYETYELRGARPDFRDGVYTFKRDFGADAVPMITWERGRPYPALTALNVGRALYRQFS